MRSIGGEGRAIGAGGCTGVCTAAVQPVAMTWMVAEAVCTCEPPSGVAVAVLMICGSSISGGHHGGSGFDTNEWEERLMLLCEAGEKEAVCSRRRHQIWALLGTSSPSRLCKSTTQTSRSMYCSL